MDRKVGAFILIFISVLMVDVGQLLLKKGLNTFGSLDFSQGVIILFWNVFTTPIIFFALCLLVLSSVTWLLALSKTELSFAYPIISIGYVIVSILSWIFLAETISLLRWIGLGVIVGGVYLLSKT
jgi:multidrug transporter EmrE-like cation transporter